MAVHVLDEKETNLQHVEQVSSSSQENVQTEHVLAGEKGHQAPHAEPHSGLRIDGDDLDHYHEPEVRVVIPRILAILTSHR
jgi:hypothetical protein